MGKRPISASAIIRIPSLALTQLLRKDLTIFVLLRRCVLVVRHGRLSRGDKKNLCKMVQGLGAKSPVESSRAICSDWSKQRIVGGPFSVCKVHRYHLKHLMPVDNCIGALRAKTDSMIDISDSRSS